MKKLKDWLEVLEGCQGLALDKLSVLKFFRPRVLCGLAGASFGERDYQMAVERGAEAVRGCEEYLGPDHANTMRSKHILAKAQRKAGDTRLAAKSMEDLIKARERIFGTTDYSTVDSAESLACIQVELGNMVEANKIFERYLEPVMIRSDQLPGKFLNVGRHYAVALLNAGQPENAKLLQNRQLAMCKDVLGPTHPTTVGWTSDIAVTYSKQNEWGMAELLSHWVLEYIRQKEGLDHEMTLLVMRNYSDTLFNMKKWREAAQLSSEEVQRREAVSQDPNPEIIVAAEKASRAFVELGQWSNAQIYLEKEIKWKTGSTPEENATLFQATSLAALSSLHTASWKNAQKWLTSLFKKALDGSAVQLSTFLPILHQLEVQCEHAGWLEEAEQLLILDILSRKRLTVEGARESDLQERGIRLQHILKAQGKSLDGAVFNPNAIIACGRLLEN